MKKQRSQPTALATIDLASLDGVTGGRVSQSQGPDPQVVAGMKSLAETVTAVGQAMNQAKQQKQAEMGQMMQQMMARRG
ncbi:MAG: hypothetical protein AB7T06_29395 [Kofleriaceae bacterium]